MWEGGDLKGGRKKPDKQHQRMEYGSFLEWHQQFSPIVQELDQCLLGCEHIHEEE